MVPCGVPIERHEPRQQGVRRSVHVRGLLQLWDGAKDHRHHTVPLLKQAGQLDPDIRKFAAEMTAAWARYGDLGAVSPAEARRIAEKVRAPWTRGGPRMERISEQGVPAANGPVRIRCYDPGPDGTKPALIYLHGGGWTLFSLDTHDR